jgi:hypothetical protein
VKKQKKKEIEGRKKRKGGGRQGRKREGRKEEGKGGKEREGGKKGKGETEGGRKEGKYFPRNGLRAFTHTVPTLRSALPFPRGIFQSPEDPHPPHSIQEHLQHL